MEKKDESGAIKYLDEGAPEIFAKPPKGYIEIRIKMEDTSRHVKLGQLKEKGIYPIHTHYSMGRFVYWIPKDHRI